jgi:hypothetical protein
MENNQIDIHHDKVLEKIAEIRVEMREHMGYMRGKLESIDTSLKIQNSRISKNAIEIDKIKDDSRKVTNTQTGKATAYGAGGAAGIVGLWELIKTFFNL